jgi:hypothetical protein
VSVGHSETFGRGKPARWAWRRQFGRDTGDVQGWTAKIAAAVHAFESAASRTFRRKITPTPFPEKNGGVPFNASGVDLNGETFLIAASSLSVANDEESGQRHINDGSPSRAKRLSAVRVRRPQDNCRRIGKN